MYFECQELKKERNKKSKEANQTVWQDLKFEAKNG